MPEVGLRLDELLREGSRVLAAAGLPEPGREALRLWADLAAVAPGEAALRRGEGVAPAAAARFEGAVNRRAAGEPLAYVTGLAGFRRLELRVDARVLIPRPETEGLVERVLAWRDTGVVADVGTGSGCIALALADEGRYARVVALDASADALAVARANAARLGLPVRFARGDLATALGDGSVDLLVSNPPYLTAGEYGALDGAVRDWEPRLALESGADGLAATRALLAEGRRVVRPGGLVALEVDCARAATAAALARDLGWGGVEVHDDLFGRERYLLARQEERP